jgi:DNA-binding LacI/PurR family transcriptional regulator
MAVSLLVRLLESRAIQGIGIELQTRLVVRESSASPGG